MKLLEATALGRGVRINFDGPRRLGTGLTREVCFRPPCRQRRVVTGAYGHAGPVTVIVQWHRTQMGPSYLWLHAGALGLNVYRTGDPHRLGVAWNRIGDSGVIGAGLNVRRVCAVLNWRRA